MRNRTLTLGLVVVSTLCSYACEDNGVRTSIGPSHLAVGARFVSRGVAIEPAVIRARSSHSLACPTGQQFTLPFDLFVRADGGAALSLGEVRVHLFDRRGRRRATSAFAGPRLIGLFGSTLVPPFATRTFPFIVPAGCDFVDGRLSVVVVAVDAFGREGHLSTEANVVR